MVERERERTVSRASFWYLDDGSVWTAGLTAADKERALAGALAAVKEMQSEERFEPTVAPPLLRVHPQHRRRGGGGVLPLRLSRDVPPYLTGGGGSLRG